MDINIEIQISQSSATLEFVPEEARLLIADEDDQFFFQIRWALHICQDFNCQDFELIIFGNVSAVQWLIQGGSQGLDDCPPPPAPYIKVWVYHCCMYCYVFKLLSEPDIKLNCWYSLFKVRLRHGLMRFFGDVPGSIQHKTRNFNFQI